jgi:hypothetical protein
MILRRLRDVWHRAFLPVIAQTLVIPSQKEEIANKISDAAHDEQKRTKELAERSARTLVLMGETMAGWRR